MTRHGGLRAIGVLAVAWLSECRSTHALQADGGAGDADCPETFNGDLVATSAWTPFRGAVISGGEVDVAAAAMCNYGGVAKTLALPPPQCARPLTLTIDGTINPYEHDLHDIAVQAGQGWTFLPPNSLRSGSKTLCLGASAFEASAPLAIAMPQPDHCPPDAGEDDNLAITGVSIAADDGSMCPPLGKVADGDFEGDATSWALSPGTGTIVPGPGMPIPGVAIEVGIGEGGSRAGHLTSTTCMSGVLLSSLSIPTVATLPAPALRLWINGDVGSTTVVQIGSDLGESFQLEADVDGQGKPAIETICIPRWLHGTVGTIQLYLPIPAPGSCPANAPHDVAVDGLAFVSDPRCALDAGLFDPGFESATKLPTQPPVWLTSVADPPRGSVALVVAQNRAHSGAVAARLAVSSLCADARISQSVTIPRPSGPSGPSLSFWYQTDGTMSVPATVEATALGQPRVLPPAAGWTQAHFCLDPRLVEWPDTLTFHLTTPMAGPCPGIPEQTFVIDDVELNTDTSCPSM